MRTTVRQRILNVVQHHVIPLHNVECVDWHLRNLWDGGWETIEEVTVIEHKVRHTSGYNLHQWKENLPCVYSKEKGDAS